MQDPRLNYIDDVVRFLIKNGSTLFSTTWLTKSLLSTDAGVFPTMILAPTDAGIAKLIKAANLPWEEIIGLPNGIDILENHISVIPTRKEWPMFTSINGRMYGSSQADLDALLPSASISIELPNGNNVVVIAMGTVIVYDDQLTELRTSDDEEFFKRLLRAEFNFDWAQSLANESPKELYQKLQSFRIDTYVLALAPKTGVIETMGVWMLVENNKINDQTALAVRGLTNRGYFRISVPLEGWFSQNVRAVQFTRQGKQLNTPMYLFFIKGRPETATLVRNLDNVAITLDTSNDWFADYFVGKTLSHVARGGLRGFRTPKELMQAVLRTYEVSNQIEILINDVRQTLVYIVIKNNQILG